MRTNKSIASRAGLLLAVAVSALGAHAAHAADASPWADDQRSALRLISGSASRQAAPLRAGIEIKLQPGWKTYWRYPGDSGVPPRFDFSGSENLQSAKVLWPAPHAFSDETGTSIGYKGSVVLPLQITPREPGKAVTLRLKADYAVCEKLCIPAEGKAALTLAQGGSGFDAAIAEAEGRIPQPALPQALGLKAVRGPASALKPSAILDLASPHGETYEVFVEGPDPQWALPIPKPTPGAPAGRQRYGFTLEGVPAGVDPNGPLDLTFTIVGKDTAVETTLRLD